MPPDRLSRTTSLLSPSSSVQAIRSLRVLLSRQRNPADAAWEPILRLLGSEDTYEAVIDAVLARVSELIELPDAYLYLSDASGRRLHLGRARARPTGDPTRTAPDPMVSVQEGGIETTAPMPPLEILRG